LQTTRLVEPFEHFYNSLALSAPELDLYKAMC